MPDEDDHVPSLSAAQDKQNRLFSERLTTISLTKLRTLAPKITLITRNSTTHTSRESLSNLPVTKSHKPPTRHTPTPNSHHNVLLVFTYIQLQARHLRAGQVLSTSRPGANTLQEEAHLADNPHGRRL